MEAASVPVYMRVLNWLKAMPDWFKATVLGGALVLSAILAIGWASSASAGDVSALGQRVDSIESRVSAREQDDHTIHQALRRIESKLDALLVKMATRDD